MFPYSVDYEGTITYIASRQGFLYIKKNRKSEQFTVLSWMKDNIANNVLKRQFNLNAIVNFCTNTPLPHITQGLLSPIGPEHCLSSLPDWLGPGGNIAWRSSNRVSKFSPFSGLLYDKRYTVLVTHNYY
jgi:hypothetical protein